MDHFIKLFETTDDAILIRSIQKEYDEMKLTLSKIFRDGIKIDGHQVSLSSAISIPPGAFLFRESSEYKALMNKLSISKKDSYFYDSILDQFSRDTFDFSIVEFSKNIINNWCLLDTCFEFPQFTIEDVKEIIATWEVSSNYIIEQAIDLNDFAKREYKEAFLPTVSIIGKSLLEGN